MGAFNTILMPRDETCPRCGSVVRQRIQFKYGDTWDHELVVGDAVPWGGNDNGSPAILVRVLGYPEGCPVCGHEFSGVFELVVRDGVIEDIVSGRTDDFVAAGDASFLIVVP